MSTKISLFLSAIIVGATGGFAAVVYPQLAESIPMHWDLNGNADGWMQKSTAIWTLLSLLAGMFLLFQAIPLLSPKNFKVDGFLPTYNVIRVAVMALMGYICVISLIAGMSTGLDTGRALMGGLMVFLAFLGNYLGKVRRNFFIGIRVPWTLASDRNWIATHRLAARLMVLVSSVGAVAIFAGAPIATVVIVLVASLVVPVFYSLWLFRTGRDKENGVALAVMAFLTLSASGYSAEREVTFKGAGGFELKGTLAIPDTAQKGATKALLLIPGSGPSDRNGNQPPAIMTDILKSIAARLEEAGIATLRFDKRALPGYAAAFPRDLAAIDDFFSFDKFVGDADAALAFLRAQPEIDASKTGVLGHSEGATIALKMTQGKSAPAFIIMMAGAGRPIGEVLYNQLDDGMTRNGLDDSKRQANLKVLRGILDGFKASGKLPTPVPADFQLYFPPYAVKFLHTFYFFDPIPVASSLRLPVLVLQGEKDIQILASKDAVALRKAFSGNDAFTYREFPSLSHNFKLVKDENKENGFGGPLPAEVTTAITEWMAKR